jgi:hypothetical protein
MHYTKQNGFRALAAGTVPLAGREALYVTSITIVNPIATAYLTADKDDSYAHWKGVMAAFGVGLVTGMVTAPLQTLSAMLKFDKNRGKSMMDLLRNMYAPGFIAGTNRIFFGAGTRSVRLGGAGILYFEARNRMQTFTELSQDFY